MLPFFRNKDECCFDKFERCFDIVAGVDGTLYAHDCLLSFVFTTYASLPCITWRGPHVVVVQ